MTCMEKICRGLQKVGRWFCKYWKTILGVLFKVAIIIIGVFAAFVLAVILHEEWDDHYGVSGCRIISEKHKIEVCYYPNGEERLNNYGVGKWTSPKIRWAGNEPPQDSISVYCELDGKRGFYNTHTGKITLKGRYHHAWYFSDGVAGVVGEDNKVRFVNYDGSEAVPGAYYYSHGSEYVFHDGLCLMYNDSTDTYGMLRKDGTWALEPVYSQISACQPGGWRIVEKEDGYRLLRRDLTEAFPGPFEYMEMAGEGRGVYVIIDYVKQLLDYDGHVLEPFVIDGTYPLKYVTKYNDDGPDEYEIIPEIVVYQVNGREGLMDKKSGKVLTPAKYLEFNPISRNLVLARIGPRDEEGVIMDLKGHIVKN